MYLCPLINFNLNVFYVAEHNTLQIASCRLPLSSGSKGLKGKHTTGELTYVEEPEEIS